jgi:hypothetical protein
MANKNTNVSAVSSTIKPTAKLRWLTRRIWFWRFAIGAKVSAQAIDS